MIKKLLSFSGLLAVLAVILFGRLIYMNIRNDDPLPYGFQQYSVETFADTQAEGGPILVDVYASWCPTCLAQHKVLNDLLRDPAYKDVKGFRVDYEGDPDFVRPHKVQGQSSILIFNGSIEISRSIGATDEQTIRGQLTDALQQIKASDNS